jgi:hypothetical protein
MPECVAGCRVHPSAGCFAAGKPFEFRHPAPDCRVCRNFRIRYDRENFVRGEPVPDGLAVGTFEHPVVRPDAGHPRGNGRSVEERLVPGVRLIYPARSFVGSKPPDTNSIRHSTCSFVEIVAIQYRRRKWSLLSMRRKMKSSQLWPVR